MRLSGDVISETHPQAGSAYDALIPTTSPATTSLLTRGFLKNKSQGLVPKIETGLNSWD